MPIEPISKKLIMAVVNKYIGVSNGYLGDFSYRSHADFYSEFCELDIDVARMNGTTRERFITIVSDAQPTDQAKILKGVLLRFPINSDNIPETRTIKLKEEIQAEIARLERTGSVESLIPAYTVEVVDRAIRDAETLIKSNGPTSAVDRVHTALHGFLLNVCKEQGLALPTDPTIQSLFKLLRDQHPAFNTPGHRGDDITKIMRSSAAILDAINPLRNRASMAHPNDALLESEEAMLVINIARSILQYLDSKLFVYRP